ncbi:hypothetical protein NFI96_018766, partial [Prochilodus magdalenae]
MTPKEFTMVLERSLARDKAAEEKVMDPAEVTVIYRCPLNSCSGADGGMKDQIMKLQSGLELFYKESSSDSVQTGKLLASLFTLTKGTYFSRIQEEVIRTVRSLLPPEMSDAVNNYTVYSLTSSVYEELLKQISSFPMAVIVPAAPWDHSVLTGIMDVSKELLLTTMKKLQDFCQMCTVCGWLRTSRGSFVNIYDELEAKVHPLTTKVAGAIFRSMLSISSEGTSKDALYCPLDTPLSNFIQAVDLKIRAESMSSPFDSNRTDEQLSPQEQNDFATKEIHPVASCFDLTEKVWSSNRPRCERVLESIILGDDTQRDLCFSSKYFFVEASRMVSQIINSESAASEVVSALVSELKSTFEDCVLADPSVAPALYTKHVQMVSDNIVRSIKATLMEVVLTDIFKRTDEVMSQNTDRLKFDLLFGSRKILNTIIDSILEVVTKLRDSKVVFKRFLYTFRDCLNLSTSHLSEFCKATDESSEESSKDSLQSQRQRRFTVRFPRIPFPKLTFK